MDTRTRATPDTREQSPYAQLGILAFCIELLLVFSLLREYPLLGSFKRTTDLGGLSGHSAFAFWEFVAGFILLFLLMGQAWRVLHDTPHSRAIWFVLGTGTAFSLTMIFVYPITAIDIYAYVAEGWLLVHYHLNPIVVAPLQVPGDPLMHLAAGWAGFGSPYGPVGIVVDALPVWVARGDLLVSLVGLKVMFSAFAIGSAYLVYKILELRAPKVAVSGALLVAWNPLVLFETSANGHNDIVMMFFALLAIYLACRAEHVMAPVVLTISVLAKYGTVIFFPVLLLHGLMVDLPWRRKVINLLMACGASALVAVILFSKFWHGMDTLSAFGWQDQRHIESFGGVLASLWPGQLAVDRATWVGRLLFVPMYGLACWMVIRRPALLLEACYVVAWSFLAFAAANYETWYAVWALLPAAASQHFWVRLSAITLAAGTTLSASFYAFVLVWLGTDRPTSFPIVNNLSYLLSFLPAGIFLAFFLLDTFSEARTAVRSTGAGSERARRPA